MRPTTNQPWRRPSVWNNNFSETPQANSGEDLTPVEIVTTIYLSYLASNSPN